MFKLLRRPAPYQTELAMIGARSGDRVFVTGHDYKLAAAVALATGLNGQTVALASPEARAAVEAAAREAGALVELATTIADDAAFDIGVWQIEASALAGPDASSEARTLITALRSGGRLVILARTQGGLFRKPQPVDDGPIIALLVGVGAKAARTLGSADAITYYEARKA